MTTLSFPVSLQFRRLSLPLFVAMALVAVALVGCGDARQNESEEDAKADEAIEANVLPIEEVQPRADSARERLTQNEGGERILSAIEAHGGLKTWYRAPTSSYTWEYANKEVDLRFKSFLVVDNRTRRVYHDLLTVGTYDDAKPVDARFAWTGERAWIAPASLDQPNPRFWALSGFYFQQIPFVFADPGLNYRALPDDTLDGEPHDMVEVTFEQDVGDSPGDTYTLYLDKDSDQVDAIRYTVSFGRDVEQGVDLPETFFDYQDYVTVDGLTVPTRFEGYAYSEEEGPADTLRNEAIADSISYRRPFDESKLAAPENARFVPLPKGD